MLFWSLDFNDIKEKIKHSLDEIDLSKTVWRAILCVQLYDDFDILLTSSMIIPNKELSTLIYCSSQNGELY